MKFQFAFIVMSLLAGPLVRALGWLEKFSYRPGRSLSRPGVTLAEATILSVRHKRIKRGLPCLELEIQVKPVGARSFVAAVKCLAGGEGVGAFRQGKNIRVAYNPAKPKQVRVLAGV